MFFVKSSTILEAFIRRRVSLQSILRLFWLSLLSITDFSVLRVGDLGMARGRFLDFDLFGLSIILGSWPPSSGLIPINCWMTPRALFLADILSLSCSSGFRVFTSELDLLDPMTPLLSLELFSLPLNLSFHLICSQSFSEFVLILGVNSPFSASCWIMLFCSCYILLSFYYFQLCMSFKKESKFFVEEETLLLPVTTS